jgi:hypothetical protein
MLLAKLYDIATSASPGLAQTAASLSQSCHFVNGSLDPVGLDGLNPRGKISALSASAYKRVELPA